MKTKPEIETSRGGDIVKQSTSVLQKRNSVLALRAWFARNLGVPAGCRRPVQLKLKLNYNEE